MLRIHIEERELFDEATDKFITVGGFSVNLEHSLVSLSKWEAIHEKPFLSKERKTTEEMLSYIKCMAVDRELSDEDLFGLTQKNADDISEYIDSKQSATWFSTTDDKRPSSEVVTSELIYYWIFSLQIHPIAETWHLNRLMTLIRVFNIKNGNEKKMSQSEIAEKQRRLNAERRARYNTKG